MNRARATRSAQARDPRHQPVSAELLDLAQAVRRIGCGLRADPESIAVAKDEIAHRLTIDGTPVGRCGMTDVVVATITKNSREEIRVTLGEFHGKDIINLRVWFRGGDDQMRPGKGLACRIDLLPQLATALAEAERQARAEGLIP